MISPELLHRYHFFKFLNSRQLKAVAKFAREESFAQGEVLFNENQPASALYILLMGNIELIYRVADEIHPELSKELAFGTVNPGEIFGISSLIKPYIYTSSARAARPGRAILIDAAELRAYVEKNPKLAYHLMQQVARAAVSRLNTTRLQLAATRSPVKV